MINLPAIFISNGLGAALMLTLFMSIRKVTRNVFFDERVFFLMCRLTLILCVVETASFWVDGKTFPGAIACNRVLNAMLFSIDIIFAFIWVPYVDFKLFGDRKRIRKCYPFVAIPAVIIVLLACANVFVDIFFTVSPDNVYSRLPPAAVTYLLTYLYLLLGAGLVFAYRKKVGKYLFMPVVVFLTPIFIGSLLQFFFYGIALIWVSVAFGLTSLYINIQNEYTLIDPLTKLYNREYLFRFLHTASLKCRSDRCVGGVMMDVNAFKTINDTYGHSEGDAALQAVSRCIMDVLQDEQFGTRYGGDEFIVLCYIRQESELDALVERLKHRLERENTRGNRPYRLDLSIGYTLYTPDTDNPDSFLKRMDSRMYTDKRRFYSLAQHNRRQRSDDVSPANAAASRSPVSVSKRPSP